MKYKIEKIVDKIEKIVGKKQYEFAFVMGSGLIKSMPEIQNKTVITYKQLGLEDSEVLGHKGEFVFGTINGKNILTFARFHYYESGDINKVMLPYKIVACLGAKKVIMTTATGGVNLEYNAGDVMIIKDHINFTGINPLVAIKPIEFIDVRSAYDVELSKKILEFAKKNKLDIKYGVHLQFSGPTYETPAEVIMARVLGADSVSMSTSLDIIICAKLRLKVLAIAMISNKAISYNDQPLTHQDVLKAGNEASIKIQKIINYILA